MAELKHIIVPWHFHSDDIMSGYYCSKANGWDAAKKALKLHTLLEGEALAGWTELIEKQQADLTAMTRKN